MSTAVETPPPQTEPVDALDNNDLFEIVDGVQVEMPPMSADSQVLASRVVRHLSNFGIDHDLGEAYTEVLFKLPLPIDRNRRPDAAFVPYSRWPKDESVPDTNAWSVLPSLCIEVVSPTDLAEEVATKVSEYFRAGVGQVWVVYPRHQLMYVHRSPTEARGLSRDDVLEGGDILPGFRLPLSVLFPKPRQMPSIE